MRGSPFPGSDLDFADRQICILGYASPAHAALGWHSFSLPSLCNPDSALAWEEQSLARAQTQQKGEKSHKGNLTAQQTLLGSLLERAGLFQPHQAQLWWFPCGCSCWGRCRWGACLLAGFVSQASLCHHPWLTSWSLSLLAQGVSPAVSHSWQCITPGCWQSVLLKVLLGIKGCWQDLHNYI